MHVSKCSLRAEVQTAGEAMEGEYTPCKTWSVAVRNHIRNRPTLFPFAFSKIIAAMSFPSQGRRRSNSHWTYPRGRGTVSCVLHVLLQYYTIAIEFAHLTGHWSGMDKNCDGQFIARRPLRAEIQTAGETMVSPCQESYWEPTQLILLCFF